MNELQKNSNAQRGESDVQTTTAPARITVRLPASAKLYVGGTLCKLTSSTRSFQTPKLDTNRRYYYDLRVVMQRDGQSVTENRRVIIQGGQSVQVGFGSFNSVVRR